MSGIDWSKSDNVNSSGFYQPNARNQQSQEKLLPCPFCGDGSSLQVMHTEGTTKRGEIEVRNKLTILALAVILSGCASTPNARWQYIEANPQLSDDIKGAIFHQQVKLGMTKEQVIASIGEPCGYCYGTRKSSVGDTWEYNVFGTGLYGAGRGQYVFFNNDGNVIGWNK